jgi:hypothetical protein
MCTEAVAAKQSGEESVFILSMTQMLYEKK